MRLKETLLPEKLLTDRVKKLKELDSFVADIILLSSARGFMSSGCWGIMISLFYT